ncbi:MAG: hypothetical protein ACXWKM_03640 [Phenylobacterium sp.]
MPNRFQPAAAAALAFAVALGGLAASNAGAADKPSEKKRAQVLQAVVDCRARTDPTERLACFDAAAAKLDEAEAAGQVVVVDKEQARQVRHDIFGLQLPSLDIFNMGGGGKAALAKGEDVDRITDVVKRAWTQQDGKWTIELQSGAVWRQITTDVLARDPRAGDKVEIKRASLGSFLLKVANLPAFKAHRDR